MQQRIAFGLDLRDLLAQKFETFEFTSDLGFHTLRNRASVSGPEFVEAFSCLSAHWLEPAHSLARHHPLDAVDVLDAFFDHRLALARNPAAVFLLGGGHDHHCSDTRLPAL